MPLANARRGLELGCVWCIYLISATAGPGRQGVAGAASIYSRGLMGAGFSPQETGMGETTMEKKTVPESTFWELRFILGHCQMVVALALYSSAWQLAAWWLSVTHSTETLMVRIVKLILELTLGLVMMKKAAAALRINLPLRLEIPGLKEWGKLLAAPA